MQQLKRRRRGIVLTPEGLKRLQTAIMAVEMAENNGERFTLEELSERINISTKTLSRLWSLNTGLDFKTLKLCFNAFNLELCKEDYIVPNTENDSSEAFDLTSIENENLSSFLWANSLVHEQCHQLEHLGPYPDGPVPLNSPFYVERSPIEKLVFQEIVQPGCVIRIGAPRQMGKSSLLLRLLAFAQMQGYHTVNLNCYQIDADCLIDLNKLLRCLCWRVAKGLGIEPNLNDSWDEEIGCKLNSSFYFQNCLLNQIQSPMVLVLNEVDYFFEYPHIAQEFFALLRSWCEEARQNSSWYKLRLVVVYSTEEHIPLDINPSPFNIGLPIHLPEFTQRQVEDLARRHSLNWTPGEESAQLMSLVGGHPALIRISLYHLRYQGITVQKLLREAITNGSIYRYHLWRLWMKLREKPNLAKIYTEIVAAKQKTSVSPIDAYKLDGLGLIRYDGEHISPRYELYRIYFAKQLLTVL